MLGIHNGMIIVGDGIKEPKKGYIIIQGNEIIEIGWGEIPNNVLNSISQKLDAGGGYVMPGIINHHAHCCVMGPALPFGLQILPEEKVIDNLNKHLLHGTTTLLNVDGYVSWEEVKYTNKKHPINIKTTTSHTPTNIKAEKLMPGSNFRPEYEQITVEDMIENGAVAIGEIGGGHTLGGAQQEYRYIPMFIEEATGKKIGQREARELKDAILGRYIDPSAYNHSEVSKVLQKYSLDLTPEQARDIVFNSVIPTLEVALKGINEACDLARKMRVPVIVHNSAPSMHKLAEVAPQVEHFLIAAHSNHTTFEAEEAVEHAMYLRRCGAIIDISTFDLFTGKRFADSPEIFFDMLKAKTVDTISTDWGGGFYDPILLGLQRSVEKGIITIPQAVYLSSGNVARNIPGLAPKRGSITKGFIADLVITEPQNLSKVRHVLIGGAFYVKNGELV